MEGDAIRGHLVSRGHDPQGLGFLFRIARLRNRLQRDYHRRKPRPGVRCSLPAKPRVADFTAEELALIAERFSGANDPVGQAIHAKAAARANP